MASQEPILPLFTPPPIGDPMRSTVLLTRYLKKNTKFGPKVNDKVKKMNKEAGLSSFVLLVGTGLQNVHMSIEALQR